MPLQGGAIVALRAADGTIAWKAELSVERPIMVDAERAYIPSARALHALEIVSGDMVWSAETGTLTAPPLVRGGWVIVAVTGELAAFRASDGSAVWRRSLGPIEFRPAIDGDSLFVALADGRLAGLDLQTGTPQWERQLAGAPGELLAVGGRVYTGASDKHFYCVDASNGEIEWQRHVGAAPRGRAAADEEHLYFVAMDNVLRALDRARGAVRWMKGLPFRPAAGPVVMGRAVIVPGSVATLAVYGVDGTALGDIKFASPLAAIPDTVADGPTNTVMAAVTGDLDNPWTVSLLAASVDPPIVPSQPLTTLPGVSLPVALPR